MDDLNEAVVREQFSHLDGVQICISEAARKYKLHIGTVSRWRRDGYIRTLGKVKNRIMLNEADVAYIRAVVDSVGLGQGQALGAVIDKP